MPTLRGGGVTGSDFLANGGMVANAITRSYAHNGGKHGGNNGGGVSNVLISSGLNGGHTSRCLSAPNTATGRLDPSQETYVASFAQNSRDEVRFIAGDGSKTGALAADHGAKQQNYLMTQRLRRLTPLECERLQGLPDHHTRIPWRGKRAEDCPDTPRYRAIGNGFAVPVVRWIGERIKRVEALL